MNYDKNVQTAQTYKKMLQNYEFKFAAKRLTYVLDLLGNL